MKYSELGVHGRRVSRLCFGTLTISPLQRNFSPAKGARLLRHAFDLGVNFLDTAEIYDNYEHVKQAVRGLPDIVIATKCYAYDEATAQKSFERAARGLGRDYIDIFMLHEQESEHTLRGHQEALDFFLKKKQQGYIGQLGISTHFIAGVRGALKHGEITVLHPILNRRGIGICDGTTEQMEQAVRQAHEMGKGVYAMKPLGGGHLISDWRSAFDYALALPYVDSVAVGMQSEAEIELNCAYFSGEKIPRAVEETVAAAERNVIVQDWCEGCGACVGACSGGAISLVAGRASVDREKCVFCGYCGAKCPQFCIKVI